MDEKGRAKAASWKQLRSVWDGAEGSCGKTCFGGKFTVTFSSVMRGFMDQ